MKFLCASGSVTLIQRFGSAANLNIHLHCLVPYGVSRCALGDTVWYVRYPYDDHPSINFQARETRPTVIDWMNSRWAGEPAPDNCTNQLLGTTHTVTGVNGG